MHDSQIDFADRDRLIFEDENRKETVIWGSFIKLFWFKLDEIKIPKSD